MKLGLIFIIGTLIVVSSLFYGQWRKEELIPAKEKIITLNLEKVERPIYLKAKNWGLLGQHEEVVLSMSNANVSNKENDYIFYSNEVYYKTDGIKTITIFAPESSISEPLNKFTNPIVKINGLKNSSEIRDYAINFKEYGLKKIVD
jgi:hypothetical protein